MAKQMLHGKKWSIGRMESKKKLPNSSSLEPINTNQVYNWDISSVYFIHASLKFA
jgi:hypothetical protein